MAAAALDTFRCVVSLECSGEAEDEQPVTPNTSTLKKFYFNHNIFNCIGYHRSERDRELFAVKPKIADQVVRDYGFALNLKRANRFTVDVRSSDWSGSMLFYRLKDEMMLSLHLFPEDPARENETVIFEGAIFEFK